MSVMRRCMESVALLSTSIVKPNTTLDWFDARLRGSTRAAS